MIGLEGATRNTALIAQMKEIGANLLLAEHIGRAHVVGGEPADRLDVDVPGPLGKTGKPHVVDHTLTQRGHGRSPFEFRHQDLCPGTDQIPQPAALNDSAPYGEAVQSNPWWNAPSIETVQDRSQALEANAHERGSFAASGSDHAIARRRKQVTCRDDGRYAPSILAAGAELLSDLPGPHSQI